MRSRTSWLGGLAASLFCSSLVLAQAPPAIPPGVPGAPAPAAPAPRNIWSFFCMTPEQRQACRDKFCKSPLGQMSSAASGPLSALSGGLITNKCAQNAIDNGLKKPADSAEGAAARIKQDEAEAQARREAVRYLGTVDCNYWPEAQDALITSLRGDRNECVRFEAALALQRGCCCTCKVIAALNNTVIGTDEDGFPAENSERVRAAAADALARCVSSHPMPPLEEAPGFMVEPLPIPNPLPEKDKEKQPELKKEPMKTQLSPSEYYKAVSTQPRSQWVMKARRTLAEVGAMPASPEPAPAAPAVAAKSTVPPVSPIPTHTTPQTPAQPTSTKPAQPMNQFRPISRLPESTPALPASAPADQERRPGSIVGIFSSAFGRKSNEPAKQPEAAVAKAPETKPEPKAEPSAIRPASQVEPAKAQPKAEAKPESKVEPKSEAKRAPFFSSQTQALKGLSLPTRPQTEPFSTAVPGGMVTDVAQGRIMPPVPAAVPPAPPAPAVETTPVPAPTSGVSEPPPPPVVPATPPPSLPDVPTSAPVLPPPFVPGM